tara:strand:+ start:237 stop:518 length:282 start_codon:yes stop_codon:yes gene_type:complete
LKFLLKSQQNYLLWVDPFWGRENPREHGRYTPVSKTGQKYGFCYDFAAPSLINVDFEERFEPLSAWKFQKGGGPELAVFRGGSRVLIDFERGP